MDMEPEKGLDREITITQGEIKFDNYQVFI